MKQLRFLSVDMLTSDVKCTETDLKKSHLRPIWPNLDAKFDIRDIATTYPQDDVDAVGHDVSVQV